MEENLNEGRLNLDLCNKVREKGEPFTKMNDNVLNNCIKVYLDDADVSSVEFNPDDFVEWFNESDSIGSFIIDFWDQLGYFNMVELGRLDPKFQEAVKKVASKYGFIDKEGREVVDLYGGVGKVADYDHLIRYLIMDACKTPVAGSKKPFDKDAFDKMTPEEKWNSLSNEDELNYDLEKTTFEDIAKAYKEVKESLTEEVLATNDELTEAEEPEEAEPVENTEETPAEDPVNPDELSMEEPVEEPAPTEEPVAEPMPTEIEPSQEAKANANSTAILGLINQMWDTISNINGTIATIEYDYSNDNLDDVKNILNDIVDSCTINVGMLNKVIELLDEKKSRLLKSGEEKAASVAVK